jgi:transglutaminase-like putative cysteine protease
LNALPLPGVAPTAFPSAVLAACTQLPGHLDPRIGQLALHLTAQAPTTYEKVTALETYLRLHYVYDSHLPTPPPGVEATSWFLFQIQHGFSDYFATAMAVLARTLGIPARIVTGYTAGTFDVNTHTWTVHRSDEHTWTQIYFARYGWINFEPSATYPLFPRPL